MKNCPICNTKIEKENQDYCSICAWEFECFFDELSINEKDRYLKRLKISKSIYKKSIDNREIQSLYKKIQELEKNCVENKKNDLKYLLLDENKKSDVNLKILNKSIIYFIWNSVTVLFFILILLAVFTVFMILTFKVGEEQIIGEYSTIIIGFILFIEGIFLLRTVKKDFRKLLIEKKLVKSDEKSPIFYFIGIWIGFLIYIPLEILKYFFRKVRK